MAAKMISTRKSIVTALLLGLCGLAGAAEAPLPCDGRLAFLGEGGPASRVFASAIDYSRVATCGPAVPLSLSLGTPARLDRWLDQVPWTTLSALVYRLPFEEALTGSANGPAVLARDAVTLRRIRQVAPGIRIVFTGMIGFPAAGVPPESPIYSVLAPYRDWVLANRQGNDLVVDILSSAPAVGGPTRLVALAGQIATAERLMETFAIPAGNKRETYIDVNGAFAAPTNTNVSHLVTKRWISWSQNEGIPLRPYVWMDPDTEAVLRGFGWHRSAASTLRVRSLREEHYRLRVDGKPVVVLSREDLERGVDTGQWLHNAHVRASRLFSQIHDRTACHLNGETDCEQADTALQLTLEKFSPGLYDYELEPVQSGQSISQHR